MQIEKVNRISENSNDYEMVLVTAYLKILFTKNGALAMLLRYPDNRNILLHIPSVDMTEAEHIAFGRFMDKQDFDERDMVDGQEEIYEQMLCQAVRQVNSGSDQL